MEIVKVKEEITISIVQEMTKMGWLYKRVNTSFTNNQNEWVLICELDFLPVRGYISLLTRYYISSKVILADLKRHIKKNEPYMTKNCFGGNAKEIANYFGIEWKNQYSSQILLDGGDINLFIKEWVRDFKSIGQPFFDKFCSYRNLSDAINVAPFDEMVPLALSGANRWFKGPIIALHAGMSKDDFIKMMNEYEATLLKNKKEYGTIDEEEIDDFKALQYGVFEVIKNR